MKVIASSTPNRTQESKIKAQLQYYYITPLLSSKVKQKLKLHFFLRQLDVLIKQEIKHTQSLLSEEENPLLHILILIYSTTAGLQSPVPWFFFFQYSELKKKRKEKSLLNQTMVTDHFYPRTESSISLWEESNVWNHTLRARQRKLSIRGSTEIWVHITNWLFKKLIASWIFQLHLI